uniref:Uncharacterized protein n=1 Tax=Rhodopseudomonas palustris (strain BisA53) TaxID=316055 RepID=Q07TD6_RHOP5
MIARLLLILLLGLGLASAPPAHADDIDTEHLFGFMIGSDVGALGEREFQSQSTARLGRDGGRFRALQQQFELEFVPAPNVRVEVGSGFAAHDIAGVQGLDDRQQFSWQGASIELRTRLLERERAPFGLTLAFEAKGNRIEETSALPAQRFGAEWTLALDRELLPNRLLAAVNLFYEPEWSRRLGAAATERESTLGAAAALMARLSPRLLLGGEARYLRKYEGIGLTELAGQALFVGPTVHVTLTKRSWLTAAWSVQAFGRPAGASASLDPVHFDRQQLRLVYGVNF